MSTNIPASVKKIVGGDIDNPDAILTDEYRQFLYKLRGQQAPPRASADGPNGGLFVRPREPERTGLFGRVTEEVIGVNDHLFGK